MKLWLIESRCWGVEFNIVRAETKEEAIKVAWAGAYSDATELDPEGGEAVLWNWSHSPDSGE